MSEAVAPYHLPPPTPRPHYSSLCLFPHPSSSLPLAGSCAVVNLAIVVPNYGRSFCEDSDEGKTEEDELGQRAFLDHLQRYDGDNDDSRVKQRTPNDNNQKRYNEYYATTAAGSLATVLTHLTVTVHTRLACVSLGPVPLSLPPNPKEPASHKLSCRLGFLLRIGALPMLPWLRPPASIFTRPIS